ncbi:MAG: hypothetical protein ACLS6B_10910, partial [Clostridium sp.]
QEFPELKIWYDAVETTANFGWAMRGSMKKKTERRETEHAVAETALRRICESTADRPLAGTLF